ncbi:MAG: right-handed parallel beta-helix repeat-containing protein [Fibrobacter sp.]|nr:right-handed parallel beta-helix repeat-containing protein [Fibrobacter sp.]
MKISIVGLFSAIILSNLYASSLVITSDVTVNTTWDADSIIIDKEFFEVKENARLTIASGVNIVFKKDISLITVYGTISAIGKESDSIHITRMNPQKTWQGIRLVSRDNAIKDLDSSYIEYCDLRNAMSSGSDKSYEQEGGVLHCGKGNFVALKHCNISKVMGEFGGAIYVDSSASIQIENCTFSSNKATFYGGGAITTSPQGASLLSIANCRFQYNYARTGGAIRIGKGSKAEINNCIFYNDTTHSINPVLNDLKGGALAIFGPADVTLRNCLIYHCRSYGKGGGIYSSDASIKLINCTIARNASVYGGGIYFARDSLASSPLLINTIEGGNGRIPGVKLPRDSAGWGMFLDSSVTPIFQYCHLSDTVYDYTIKPYQGEFIHSRYYETDFMFRALASKYPPTAVEAYQLSSNFAGNDLGIDGGTPDTTGLGLPEFDVLGQKRINGSAIDIGAIEYNDSLLKVETIFRKLRPQHFNVQCLNGTVYSIDGRLIGQFTGDFVLPAFRSSTGIKISRGLYIVRKNLTGGELRIERVLVR